MISALGYLQVAALGRLGRTRARSSSTSRSAARSGARRSPPSLAGTPTASPASALLLAVGVLATVAQLLLTRAYARGNTLVNASLQYLGIAFSYLYGVVLFDDHVTWVAALGMVAIVGAGVLASLVRARHARREAWARS
jgi:S-adenosylmethionine uptake transporter